MNNLKKNLKENKYIYLIMFFIIFSIFGFFAIDRFATDTYYFHAFGMKNNAIKPYFHDGRIIMTLFLYILDFLKISCTTEKTISWLLAIVSLFLGSAIFYNIIKKHSKNKTLNLLTSICLVANPFVIETFIFTEYTGIMCLGILFIFISVFFTTKYWEDKKIKDFLISLSFALLSVMCYQGIISLLFIVPVLLVLKYSPDFKTFVKNIFSSGIIFSIGALSTALLTKFLGASRLATKIDLMKRISDLFDGVVKLLTTTYKMIPENVLLIFFAITLVICFIFLKKKKENISHLILVLLVLFIVPALPHIFVDSVWMVPRSNIGYGTIVVIPILFYMLYGKEKKIANYSFILIMGILLVLQFQSSISFVASQIRNDLYLRIEANKVYDYIEEYEKENSIEVSKYKIYYDKNTTYVYSGIKFGGDINVRALTFEWSYNSVIKYLTGRELKDGKDNEEVKAYCESNDWQEFNEEQLRIIDDTIYICNY